MPETGSASLTRTSVTKTGVVPATWHSKSVQLGHSAGLSFSLNSTSSRPICPVQDQLTLFSLSLRSNTNLTIMAVASQPPDMRIGELADLIRERQAASAEEAGAAADAPADRIPMLVTPRRGQPQRCTFGSPTAIAPVGDAVSPGLPPAAFGRSPSLPLGAVASGAACALAPPVPSASHHTARCSGGASLFLVLPSPRRLLSSLTAAASGAGGRAEASGAALRESSALMGARTSAIMTPADAGGGVVEAGSPGRGMCKAGSFSLRALWQPRWRCSLCLVRPGIAHTVGDR